MLLSVESFRDVIGPLARSVGERLARAFGVSEDLEVRLERIHAAFDATAFRVRQVGWAAAAFGLGGVGRGWPPVRRPSSACCSCSAPRCSPSSCSSSSWPRPSARWQRPPRPRAAGRRRAARHAAGGRLLARRRPAPPGRAGAAASCAGDLARVGRRIRQGLSEADALPGVGSHRRGRAGSTGWSPCSPSTARRPTSAGSSPTRPARSAATRTATSSRSSNAAPSRSGSPSPWPPSLPGAIFLTIPFVEALRLYGNT